MFKAKEKEIKIRILPNIHHPEMTLDEAWKVWKEGYNCYWISFSSYVLKLRRKGWIIT